MRESIARNLISPKGRGMTTHSGRINQRPALQRLERGKRIEHAETLGVAKHAPSDTVVDPQSRTYVGCLGVNIAATDRRLA